MKYIIKQKNRIECISKNGDYHGFFTIKNVDIVLSAKNPRDLDVLMKFRHKIEEQIVDYLNSKSYKKTRNATIVSDSVSSRVRFLSM